MELHAEGVFIAGYLRQFETDTRRFPPELIPVYLSFYGSCFDNATAISLQDALSLEVGDWVDVRTKTDGFRPGTVASAYGGKLSVSYRKHYASTGKIERFFIRVNCYEELHLIAKCGSISARPRHRFHGLKCNDFVDVNPIGTHLEGDHPGWVHGEVCFISKSGGQIEIEYDVSYTTEGCTHQCHIDQTAEVAEFGSHTEPTSTLLRKLPAVLLADDDSCCWSLKSYFTFYRCLAQAIYGDASRQTDVIRVRDDYAKNNEAVIRRMKSLLQFGGQQHTAEDCIPEVIAEDSITQQNAVQLDLAVLSDALGMRIKLYAFPDWCEAYDYPDIPLQLWADYTGLDCGAQQTTIRLAFTSNVYGILQRSDESETVMSED